MLAVVWHPEAELDLLEIIQYLAERSPQAARDLGQRLRDSVLPLSQYPYLFKTSIRLTECREIVVHPNYLVFYTVQENRVLVVKVAHSRQQFP